MIGVNSCTIMIEVLYEDQLQDDDSSDEESA